MTIYIDISRLEYTRSNTGIQRVLKELLQRMVTQKKHHIKIISYNTSLGVTETLDNHEILHFLNDIEHYQFKKRAFFDLENIQVKGTHIFFDIDSVWSVDLKREELYPKLKANGFLIFNFLYDFVPLVMPTVAHEVTVMQFESFVDAVYQHSDMLFFCSHSTKRDFLERKEVLKIERNIPNRVVGLGSDFLELTTSVDKTFANNILDKRYILFVGTIEPRKNQKEMLDAFEILAKKYPDLHLVIIGTQGWNVSRLIHRIKKHPLKDTQLHWFSNIDDNLLKQFYKNAFIVTYLSKYEGYGLPIVESLQFGNVTLTSKNSSMVEAGREFADYTLFNSKNEIVDIISLYHDNPPLYQAKKSYIKQHFKALSWDSVYHSISDVFSNHNQAESLRERQKNNPKKELQFVFISISFESIETTITKIDEHIDFVKEYIVITQPKLVEKFKTVTTDKNLIIIDENEILQTYKTDFHLRDHQSKNWLLRLSLLNLEILDNEFIMLDDDNQPLKNIPIEFFISKDGCYNAYYFYNLLEWNHKGTDYDKGQHSTKEVLTQKNHELLSYSSHAPQIINRQILQEVADEFFEIGLKQPIDEWSIYFNYAISIYPSLFRQNIFQTLNWPHSPTSWDYSFLPPSYSFENYYPELYAKGVLQESMSYQEKIEIKNREITPYLNSQKLFQKNISMLSENNMVHGKLSFKQNNIEFYLFGLPYLVTIENASAIRLKLNYKILNPDNEALQKIVLVVILFGKPRTHINLEQITDKSYQEGIVEIPILSQGLKNKRYNLSFDLMINKKYIYKTNSPYLMKLIIVSHKRLKKLMVQRPKMTRKEMIRKLKKRAIAHTQHIQNSFTKESIKRIPFIGWFTRWIYNLLRINRLVFQHHHQQVNLNALQEKIAQQQQQIEHQHHQIEHQHHQIEHQQQQMATLLHESSKIKPQISHEIEKQSLLFKQRVDMFINQKQEITTSKKERVKELSHNFILDEFYLAFENKFRGKREEIAQRYESYLKYLNPDIKTALDIGCGRGEWVGLLQKNSIQAQGIDLNAAMLNDGLSHGIKNLQNINAFDFFKTCPDSSFDLVTAFHIIEHIPYEELFVFLQELRRISTPNAIILLETPNPANILVGAFEFYKDPTHLNPLPDDVMKFTVEYFGFEEVRIEKLHLFPDTMRIVEHTETAQHFNHFFYQERDYLIIARNPKSLHQTPTEQPKSKKKSKLAFLSPLPPQQSGIAYYSSELLVELSKYYEIETIDDFEWFKTHHNEYQRILYHVGNSAFHVEMIELLTITSGVIVLHDFYLSNLMHHAKKLTPTLHYKEHGYQALLSSNNYPCNKTILNQATGVIIHSEYPKEMLKEWYNHCSIENWSTIPLLRTPPKKEELLLTKEMLGLPKDAFVLCSFGLLRPNKCNHQLLDAWQNSPLAKNPNCYLVFVGNNQTTTEYGKRLESATSKNIQITDWVDDITFKSYLSIADMGVQLRSHSTGETSATILDCMNHQIPLIINANGSNQEIPNDTVVILEDEFDTSTLKEAIEELYQDRSRGEQLQTRAKAHIETHHTPQICAKLYHEQIEKHHKNQNGYREREIKALSQTIQDEAELIKSISLSNFEPISQQQILIDVSTIIRNDLKTGIERVVRSQIIALVRNAPPHIRIEPVYLVDNHQKATYFYARAYTKKLLKLTELETIDGPIKLNRGDIFYGLDLCVKEVESATRSNLYQCYKNLGVSINFMVYDLLPITHPHFFPAKMEAIHTQWFKNIISISDQLICISDKVAKEVKSHLDRFGTEASNAVNITSLHLGADLETETSNSISAKSSTPITFLMVGTVEPRKGHQEVLEAFETLWAEGHDIHLKIVGKEGWSMERFIQKLTLHPQQKQKLFYLDFVSDEELLDLYTNSDCLIVASYDEGFGLPLIEGAKQGIPIIARDIEIFREVATKYAYYFKENKLHLDIKDWIKKYRENRHSTSEQMPYLSWQQNAKKLLEIL